MLKGFGLFSLIITLGVMGLIVFIVLRSFERIYQVPAGAEGEENIGNLFDAIDAAKNAKSQVERLPKP